MECFYIPGFSPIDTDSDEKLVRYMLEKDKEKDLAEGTPKPEWYGEHYEGDVQPIELMQAQFDKDEFTGGLLFNIIKYASRFGKKDEPIKDAKKILRYAEWLVEHCEGKKIDPRED